MITLLGLTGFALIVFIGISFVMSTASYAITFDIPVDCTLGESCFIQNYVDLDTSEKWADYRCGPLSYDGHKGTDFRLRDYVQMREGVAVLAAADGTVLRLRDGMEDVSIREKNAADIGGRECGNGMVIEHQGGFTTQYCHLKQGSVKVSEGEEVAAGQPIGEIGLSGSTEFPHLHFQIANKAGEIIDPFSGPMENTACNAESTRNLWSPDQRAKLAYQSTGYLIHGFTDARPNRKGAQNGEFSAETLTIDADPLVFWVESFGLRDGDRLIMQLMGPDRVALVNYEDKIEDNKATWFQFVGKRLTEDSWSEGTYVGVYRVMRDGAAVIDKQFTIDIVDSSSKAK